MSTQASLSAPVEPLPVLPEAHKDTLVQNPTRSHES